MSRSRWCLLACLLGLCVAERPSQASTRDRSVAGILQRHCVACHGPAMQSASVRLDSLSTNLVLDRKTAETLLDVRNALNSGQMPPRTAPQLSQPDRVALLDNA